MRKIKKLKKCRLKKPSNSETGPLIEVLQKLKHVAPELN